MRGFRQTCEGPEVEGLSGEHGALTITGSAGKVGSSTAPGLLAKAASATARGVTGCNSGLGRGLGFGVWGLGFRVWGLGFSLGSRV